MKPAQPCADPSIWETEECYLNVAATCPSTRALGPGHRAVIWVQGCVFNCPGCIAPDWIPLRPARLVTPAEILPELLAQPAVTGLTISGGEPMLQAAALARLVRLAKSRRDLDVICYTGFQRLALMKNPPGPGVADLLEQVDVLIDGQYIARMNDNQGLRGSHNQRVHYLSDRLKGAGLETTPRRAEVRIEEGQAVLVGVPPLHLADAVHHSIGRAVDLGKEMLGYERL